jgi:hypothetical protein
MKSLINDFKKKMRKEGRTFKWFHKTYIKGVSYVYFIIQINDCDKLHDSVKAANIEFMSE